ncbi:MAG: SDR family NAD(P)-dependent oxidoreductase [Alphaproteobacteria bacterium]|nr:SDR family NAD(P)-dependent oxidoreductase [Alphaproteobacteria bacterium]
MSISKDQKPIDTGLGDRPEPDTILNGIDLSGKTVLVTGGYSGIGLETVRALVKAGAHVHVPARRPDAARKALDNIIAPEQVGALDLGDLRSVEKFADDFSAQHDSLDLLIGNAGIMACPMAKTAQGFESQIGVNHFGHFMLVTKLMRALENAAQKNGGARVVLLSSIAHRIGGIEFDDMHYAKRDYEKWQSYGQSKTAKSLQAVALDARGKELGIRAFGVHPGGIFTPLQRHLQNEEMVALGWTKEDGSPSDMAAAGFKTPTQGAGTSLFAATSPKLDGLGGLYLNDCNIAEQVAPDSADFNGVRPWAVDSEIAEQLWQETEKQIAAL